VRTNIDPTHIQEEALNVRQLKSSTFYPKLQCKVLILRATEGLLDPDDILLPEDVLEKMIKTIPNARCAHLEGTNHYSIIFQPNPIRDKAILDFLNESPS
jgi:hypothetical protein